MIFSRTTMVKHIIKVYHKSPNKPNMDLNIQHNGQIARNTRPGRKFHYLMELGFAFCNY